MKIINLTPHDISIVGKNNEVVRTIQPQKNALRLNESIKQIGYVDGISITKIEYTVNTGLVDAYAPIEENTIYIVSLLTAKALRRKDFFIPAQLVRDKKGDIIGCKSLQQIVN